WPVGGGGSCRVGGGGSCRLGGGGICPLGGGGCPLGGGMEKSRSAKLLSAVRCSRTSSSNRASFFVVRGLTVFSFIDEKSIYFAGQGGPRACSTYGPTTCCVVLLDACVPVRIRRRRSGWQRRGRCRGPPGKEGAPTRPPPPARDPAGLHSEGNRGRFGLR